MGGVPWWTCISITLIQTHCLPILSDLIRVGEKCNKKTEQKLSQQNQCSAGTMDDVAHVQNL